MCDRIEGGRSSVFFLVQKQNAMGFFSKKAPTSDKNDTHEMVDAKIHVMQHDLDEIAKNGHVEIEPTHQEKPEPKKESPSTPVSRDALPTDSPFSQPIYPLSENTLPEKPVTTAPVPEPQQPSTLAPQNAPAPITRPSAPLNLPTFEAVPRPRESSTPTEPKKNVVEAPLPKPSATEKPLNQQETPQESLRTGTWPVEQPGKSTSTSKTSSPKSHPKKLSLRKTATDKKALSDNIILKERWGWKQLLLTLITLAILGGGAFYFWKTRISTGSIDLSALSHPNIPDISTDQEKDAMLKPEASLPFSTTNPNPFLVDVETETVSTLREQLMKNAETMQQANMTGPVPFSVVDKNNTPIAFFIFASVFNLGLSGDLLNSLDNTFTLSLFIDSGKPRIILAITEKNSANTKKYLSASEKTLPLSLKNILLEEAPPVVSTARFASGTYRDIATRYFNISTDVPLSLDYAFIDNTLLIGTSKDAERAGIDMLLSAKK